VSSILEDISVIVVSYNNKDQIKTCLKSVLSQKPSEIIVVDNNSSDGTSDLIKNFFPSIKLIYNKNNDGYGRGINLGLKYIKNEYFAALNTDTLLKENSLIELVKPLKNGDATLTVPNILFYDESSINVCGNIEHFTGLAFTRDLNCYLNKFNESKCINGLSGVCFAIKTMDYLNLGGFDENFFLYMEDVDFSWKLNSKGLKILYVPEAVVCHDYKLDVNPKKIYYLEKGRYIILRKYLTRKEYLIFLPSLIMSEILTLGYSILIGEGGLKFKLNAIKDGLTVEVQKEDPNMQELLNSLDWKIPEEQLSYSVVDLIIKKFANIIYWLNYKSIRIIYQLG
jgi:GT2 family glycosyltransferase